MPGPSQFLLNWEIANARKKKDRNHKRYRLLRSLSSQSLLSILELRIGNSIT